MIVAAIDGHAKNFSVFLHPVGGFHLTPLYDVMSAQNLFDLKQFQRKQLKLAMSVGNRNHYHVHEIQVRHYYQTAKKAGIPDSMVETALGQLVDDFPAAIEHASAALPKKFPTELRDSIAQGALKRCEALTAAVA
jgi:serine/threonine-protein kinase HipA